MNKSEHEAEVKRFHEARAEWERVKTELQPGHAAHRGIDLLFGFFADLVFKIETGETSDGAASVDSQSGNTVGNDIGTVPAEQQQSQVPAT
jgi:hypothetical protein